VGGFKGKICGSCKKWRMKGTISLKEMRKEPPTPPKEKEKPQEIQRTRCYGKKKERTIAISSGKPPWEENNDVGGSKQGGEIISERQERRRERRVINWKTQGGTRFFRVLTEG